MEGLPQVLVKGKGSLNPKIADTELDNNYQGHTKVKFIIGF